MTDFPMDAVIFNKIVEVFNQTRRYVLLLFPLAFFIRIVFGFILLKGDCFTDILKDSLFLFLGLFFFTDILKLTLQIPYFVASELSFGEWRNINFGDGIFIKPLKRLVDWIGILSYWISFGLYVVIISILGFFAGYILFLGTMFRAYGMLKVFFILLFIVSLWPLLWHSINFAVYTIAVSDNALANNVIVGGASLAKVFLPIWIFSKTSRIPVAQKLSKISYAGGGLAGSLAGTAGTSGIGAYSFLRDKTESVVQKYKDKTTGSESGGGAISITQTGEIIGPEAEVGFLQSDDGLPGEPEDFALRAWKPEKKSGLNDILSPETSDPKEITNKEEAEGAEGPPPVIQNHISQENYTENTNKAHVQNKVTNKTEESSPSSSHVIRESHVSTSKEHQSQSGPPLSEPKHQVQEKTLEISEPEKKSIKFNKSIHQEDWIEEETITLPHNNQNNLEETEI